MIKKSLLYILFTFSLLVAQDIKDTDLVKLSQNNTWLRLLYFNQQTDQSDVLSEEYFLSKLGRYNPLAELNATIEAYNDPFELDPNEHAVCRFPARYMWLSQNVDLPNYQIINPKCEKLKKSIDTTNIDSISLMFVSGYLGNPASSFGHSFIKLNNYDNKSNTNLFDLAISYGAEVPKNENIFRYMYNGLSGGYSASITDKYFFTQDLVYGNTEFRDIWEYELNLPKEKVLLFQLHLWEILGKKYQYYFLNRNCGYEISKMLEIVVDQDLVEKSQFWFAPIETFHELREVNQTKIKKIIFHPSEQKNIYQMYNKLSFKEQNIVLDLIEHDMDIKASSYPTLTDHQKIEVINFAISYYKYLLVKERNNQKYKELNKQALLERFSLPTMREEELKFEKEIAPNDNDKPFLFFANANVTNKSSDYLSLGFSPYALQGLGQNNLNGNELIVLRTEIGATKTKIFLKQFDLITIKRFDMYQIPLDYESQLSWQLNVAIKNIDIESDNYDTFLSGGVGKSWYPTNWILGYIMLNGSLHTDKTTIYLSPEIGLRLDFKTIKIRSTLQEHFDIINSNMYLESNTESNIKITKDFSFYLKQTLQDKKYELQGGMQLFF